MFKTIAYLGRGAKLVCVLFVLCLTSNAKADTQIVFHSSDFTQDHIWWAPNRYVSSYMWFSCSGDSGQVPIIGYACTVANDSISVVPYPDAVDAWGNWYYSHAFLDFFFDPSAPKKMSFDLVSPTVDMNNQSFGAYDTAYLIVLFQPFSGPAVWLSSIYVTSSVQHFDVDFPVNMTQGYLRLSIQQRVDGWTKVPVYPFTVSNIVLSFPSQGKYQLSIDLADQSVAPDNTSGDNETTVTAKLTATDPSMSVAGQVIQFSSVAQEFTGGHKHSGGRPTGTFDSPTCQTDANGICSVDYAASEVSGKETISAVLSGDKSVSDSKDLLVQVSGLEPLKGDEYTFKCAGNPSISGCEAAGYQHTDFYRVTADVNNRMSAIGSDYGDESDDPNDLIVTDASLALGGLYDIGPPYGNFWQTPHTYHREGTDIDINRPSIAEEDTFKKVVCQNGGYPDPENQWHYHLYFHIYANTPKFITVKNQCPVEVQP